MKNILFLTWKDIKHPRRGGAEKVLWQYASGLAKKGYNVFWIGSGWKGAKDFEEIDGVKIYRIYDINTIYFRAKSFIKNFIKEHKIDLIIDEAGGIPLFSPLYIKNIPIVFFIHHVGDREWDEAFPFPINKLVKFAFFNLLKKYRKVPTITVSDSTKQELVERFGFDPDKIFVIPNTIDLKPIEKIDFNKKKNEIVFLGRLMPIKGVDDAIKAFNIFYQKYKDYKLVIWGAKQDEKYFERLQNLVKKLNLTNAVEFKLDFRGDYSVLQSAKIGLVPSEKEGFGLVVYELNSQGVPVIGYNVPGLRDSIKDGINGCLVSKNYEALAQKMLEMIETDKWKDLSESALDYIKNIPSWQDNVEKFEGLVKSFIK